MPRIVTRPTTAPLTTGIQSFALTVSCPRAGVVTATEGATGLRVTMKHSAVKAMASRERMIASDGISTSLNLCDFSIAVFSRSVTVGLGA